MRNMKNLMRKLLMFLIVAVVAAGVFAGYTAEAQAASPKPVKVMIQKVSSPNAGKIKVTWKKTPKVSKYQVQVAADKKFTKGKVTKMYATNKSSATISKLIQGRKYYVRVRACRIVKGKKYYGKWSGIKNITVKKEKQQESSDKPEEEENKPEEEEDDDYKGETDLSVLRSQDGLYVTVNPPRNSLKDSDVYPYKYVYTGREIRPKVQKVETIRYSYDMVEGVDYTVSYQDNVNPGTGRFIITGMGRFHGSASYDFIIVSKEAIRKEISECGGNFLGGIAYPGYSLLIYPYTGEAVMPKIQMREGGKPLIQGIDYELSYTDNVNRGKATVTITGIGRYKGSITGNFMIM